MNPASAPNEVIHMSDHKEDMFDHKEDVEMYENKAEQDQVDQSQPLDLVSNYAALPRAQAMRKFWRLFLMGILVTSAGLYSGYTTSLPGAIVGNKGFVDQFATVTNAKGVRVLDANHVGLWGAMNYVTQAISQFGSPLTAQAFGIRFNLYLFTLLKLVTIITEIFSTTWWHFLLAKLFNGFAAGLIGTSVMSYASEIAMSQMRGTVLSSYAFFFALGQLASAIGLDIINRKTPLAFRTAFYSQFVFLGLWLPILVFLPESPVWLYKKGKHDKAQRARRRLIGNVSGYDWDHEYAVFAQEIDQSMQVAAQASRYTMLATLKGTNLRRTLMSTMPLCIQNFVGVPLMFNVVYFFSLIGLNNAFTANVIVYSVLLGGVLASFYLIDKVGRRPLLLGGCAFMSVCVFAVGGIGFTSLGPTAGNVMVALVAMWVAAYSVSIAPIGWVALVEMSTPTLRTQTAGVAALMQSCVNVLFNYTVPLMLSAQYAGWGAKIGLFFGPLAALSVIALFFLFPETKNRSYAELDELFARKISARKFSSTKTAVNNAADLLEAQTSGVPKPAPSDGHIVCFQGRYGYLKGSGSFSTQRGCCSE